MKEIWMDYGWLFAGILIAMLLSVFCQITVTFHMMKILRESEVLAEEPPQILKAWIEEYGKEKQKIGNLSVYLDRKIEQISIGRYKVSHIKHLSGQLILGMIFLAGMGACKGIIDGRTLGQILPFYIISILGVYLHFSLSAIMDLEDKKKRIHINLTDFLENGYSELYYEAQEKKEREIEKVRDLFKEAQDLELKEVIREILT